MCVKSGTNPASLKGATNDFYIFLLNFQEKFWWFWPSVAVGCHPAPELKILIFQSRRYWNHVLSIFSWSTHGYYSSWEFQHQQTSITYSTDAKTVFFGWFSGKLSWGKFGGLFGSKFSPPTFGSYPPTFKSKISGNTGWIWIWSKIPSRYVLRRSGKIDRVEKNQF